jgi:hypothetical protein
VWGGTNAGGSITTPGIGGSFGVVGTGVTGINGVGIGVGVGLGTFTQFILPDFASATCRFNITLTQVGRQQPHLGRDSFCRLRTLQRLG